MKVYVVENISENDGGYLPDSRTIWGIFSSERLAEDFKKKEEKDYDNFEITEYEVEEELKEEEKK